MRGHCGPHRVEIIATSTVGIRQHPEHPGDLITAIRCRPGQLDEERHGRHGRRIHRALVEHLAVQIPDRSPGFVPARPSPAQQDRNIVSTPVRMAEIRPANLVESFQHRRTVQLGTDEISRRRHRHEWPSRRGQLATESSGFFTGRCASAGDAALNVASLGPTRPAPSDRQPHPVSVHKPAGDLSAVTGAERSKPPPSPASTSARRASTRRKPQENHCRSTTGTKAWRQSRSHPRSQSRSQGTARRPLPQSEEAFDLLIW